MLSVDLNCDMGESFGAWSLGQDAALMKLVTSVNIACGFHAGDPSVMGKTVDLAIKNNVAIGAHPGYPDVQGFGRRHIKMPHNDVFDIILYQLGALQAFVNAAGGVMRHVKPHGALYNDAARDLGLAGTIARAVRTFNRDVILVGLAGSYLTSEGIKEGLRVANEAFIDRTYRDDGMLTPRTLPNALIVDPELAARQALHIVRDKTIQTVDDRKISVQADTLCIHGDGPFAVDHAKAVVKRFAEHGIVIRKL